MRAHAAGGPAAPKFERRRNGGKGAEQGEEEDEGGMTSDLPLRSCCKPRPAPPQQVPPLFRTQNPFCLSLICALTLAWRVQRVTVVLVAFGFKHGVPDYIDFVRSVRYSSALL